MIHHDISYISVELIEHISLVHYQTPRFDNYIAIRPPQSLAAVTCRYWRWFIKIISQVSQVQSIGDLAFIHVHLELLEPNNFPRTQG